MIKVENLIKRYGNVTAVDNISFHVEKGEILGFLGSNGAGKTTTMNMLSGYLFPDRGNIVIAGFNVAEKPLDVARHMGYLPEIPPLYKNMRVKQFLHFVAEIKGIPRGKRKSRIDYVMEATAVTEYQNNMVFTLSKGFRQRLGLASAILHNPDVLILDEPTIGLDPNQIVEIRNLIKELAGAHTVVLSSHILTEIQMICRRAVIINQGKIAAIDTIGRLRSGLAGGQVIRLETEGNEDTVLADIRQLDDVYDVKKIDRGREGTIWRVEGEREKPIRRSIFKKAAAGNWIILEMKSEQFSLEEIFTKLTKNEEESLQ